MTETNEEKIERLLASLASPVRETMMQAVETGRDNGRSDRELLRTLLFAKVMPMEGATDADYDRLAQVFRSWGV